MKSSQPAVQTAFVTLFVLLAASQLGISGCPVQDADADGYTSDVDCNDQDAAINPGAPELCDWLDNNCDGQVDEGLPTQVWYPDADHDGFGVTEQGFKECHNMTSYGPGYVTVPGDCNDGVNNIYPGAPELCNGVDDSCDGEIDDGLTLYTWYADADGDGFGADPAMFTYCKVTPGYASGPGDCNDADASINPGATEIVDGIDNDCGGAIDEVELYGHQEYCDGQDNNGDGQVDELPPGAKYDTWYVDADKDGFGAGEPTNLSCFKTGYASQPGDCNDADAAINPGAAEVFDGIDNDCGGKVDEYPATP